MIPNHIPYGLNIPPSCAPQSINIDMISQGPGTMHKGKMNGNHDVDFLNLNVANLEKQHRNFSSETFNKIHAEYPYVCNHKGTELHPKLMGSLDIYSNETIPAMHLLSLMDAGMRSTPFNMDGDTKFLERSSFPHDYRSKEFSEMDIGVYKTNHASRHLSSDYYRKNHLSEKSCECSPAIPTVSAFASFQNDVNFRRTAGFTGQVPLKPREKGKAKCSYSPTQNRGRKSQKSVSTSVGLGKNHESIPVHDTRKRFLGTSDFMLCPSQCRTIENSTKCFELEAHSSYGTVWPVKSCSETEICSINRNPADFSIPEAGNVYTIGAEDLKFGKTIYSEDRSGLISIDGHKRQRIMKLNAVKGRA
ncbi:hypothetical protein L1049_018806 [Liquidambar formosana]|uniref:Uncharacterized protein n=1 Tax=Liquidambar formosana TaxID=63359 RepID=A0AAP0RBI7_LIQFO